jgi:hypothetical protein
MEHQSRLPRPVELNRRVFFQIAAAGSALQAPAAQQTPGAAPADPGTGAESKAIYVDMSHCQPASALSKTPHPRQWRLLDYETKTLKGSMIVAGENTDAPELRLPLGTSGWHRIYVGVYPFSVSHIFQYDREIEDDEFRVELRLSGEKTSTMLTHRGGAHGRIDDFFWKAAETGGQDLIIRQFQKQLFPKSETSSGRVGSSCWIAYIKLVPVAEAEVRAIEEDRADKRNRRLYAHNDGFDYHYYYRPTGEADIRREIEPYRNSDFSRIYWEAAHGEICNYPTKIGRTHRKEWIQDHYSVGDRLSAESWTILRNKGIDPLKVAIEHAHEVGLEIHASMRTSAFHFDAPWDLWSAGGVYDQHPEWRGVGRNGLPTPRLSYAYPEVQRYIVSILEEIAGYPVDGICLLYNRRWPVVEYEPPIVESFQKKYGRDPRQLNARDPQWLAHRATFLTGFMKSVRQSMNEVSRKQGRAKPLKVSAVVATSEQENMLYAMDVRTWAREGLVDTLIPEGLKNRESGALDPRDVSFFVNSTRGSSCEVAWNMMPRQMTPEEYRARAHKLYDMGVGRLFFWDTNQRTYRYPQWTDIRRLGHREELAAWARAGAPKIVQPGKALVKLGDWVVGYADAG